MRFKFNGQVHEDMWRERGSSDDYEWSLDVVNYDTDSIVVSGIRLKQSEMDAGTMSVEDYIADWLEKLRAYLGTVPVDYRSQVTASLNDRYRAMLAEAGAEVVP